MWSLPQLKHLNLHYSLVVWVCLIAIVFSSKNIQSQTRVQNLEPTNTPIKSSPQPPSQQLPKPLTTPQSSSQSTYQPQAKPLLNQQALLKSQQAVPSPANTHTNPPAQKKRGMVNLGYGNEWINYNQQYFKIPVAVDGVYRVKLTTIDSLGIPVSSGQADPNGLQLFNKGVQQPIYVRPGTNGFIEFFGKHNDGSIDSSLYTGINFLPNPYYSLFNDTATYFLTWSVNNGIRITNVSDTNFSANLNNKPPYFWCTRLNLPNSSTSYYSGETYQSGVAITDPQYTAAEGYFGSNISVGNSTAYQLPIPNVYNVAGAPNAIGKFVYVGTSQEGCGSCTDHHITVAYPGQSTAWDTAFYGYAAIQHNFSCPVSSLTGPNLTITYSSLSSNIPADSPGSFAVGYTTFSYPHTFDMEGDSTFQFTLNGSINSKDYLLFTDFKNKGTSDSIFLYDLTNNFRIKATGPIVSGSNAGAIQVLAPNPVAIENRQAFLFSSSQVKNVSAKMMMPVGVAKSGLFTNYASLFSASDSAILMVTHHTLLPVVAGSGANTYQGYRQSITGGSHKVVVADIAELYDQFAYGINTHPLSIRGFAHLALDKSHTSPRLLYLIGKSIEASSYRGNLTNYAQCLVPTIGNPPADLMFTSWLNSNLTAPSIPTARLSAKTIADVQNYLAKVQEYETATEDSTGWMKRVLHFAGGNVGSENQSFLSQMDQWASTISGPFYGAQVSTFSKTSSAPITINTSDSLQALMNGGVSLMNFLGHSSSQSWDIGVDVPTTYSNRGRYPMIISNGCYAGDIHLPYTQLSSSTNSEYWTMIPELGSIGFLALTTPGLVNVLETFTSSFYNEISINNYGGPIAKSVADVISQNEALFSDLSYKAGFLCMTQEGDPCINLNAMHLPDYTMLTKNIHFNTQASPTGFYVILNELNLGKAVAQNYNITLIRTLPNGTTQQYLRRRSAPSFQDTVMFFIPFNPSLDPGLNKFLVSLNSSHEITESSYSNNTATANLLMPGNTILPIYPYNYSIIPSATVRLKASTANALGNKTVKYVFQLDTNDTYNSLNGGPLAQTTVYSKGGVVEWSPTLLNTNKDSLVYFWRVSADTNWHESSFQVIKGKRGWGQANFFQFKNDNYQYVNWSRNARQFQFANNLVDIHVQTGLYGDHGHTGGYLGATVGFFPYPSFSINSASQREWFCGTAMYMFAVINPVTGQPWINVPNSTTSNGQSNSINCNETYEPVYEFYVDQYHDPSNIVHLIDSVPNGYYVLCYTPNCHYDSMPGNPADNVFPAFDAIGSGQIRNISEKVPYIIWGQKGAPKGSATEIIGSSATSLIAKDFSITTSWTNGYILSPVIGPALTWDSLFWNFKEPWHGTDSVRVGVIGIKKDGTVDTLLGNVNANIQGLSRSNKAYSLKSLVNPSTYPNIQLIYFTQDQAHAAPPQLNRWQVLYTPAPDLAINPNGPMAIDTINSSALQEGDTVRFTYPVQNISEFNFQAPITYSSWIVDASGTLHNLPDRTKKLAIGPGQLVEDTVKLSTKGYPNLSQLWVEVNQLGKPTTQPEQFHFNNIANVSFTVKPDKINPLLDVTFDGVHILNNDIVSSKPNILIGLTDENKYLALNSPSLFKVYLISPGSPTPVAIPFGPEMTFYPAVLPKNSCKLNYTPNLTMDGQYTLIVQATDASGNASGPVSFQIQFEVITKSMISQLMNYPNPFSTATHFVFTITGSTVPDDILIRIMTVSGKVVREITKNELGPLHIGRNITDYAWDGRDQFGNPVGIGVYLYHVQTQLNGHSMDNYTTVADQYFTNGFGKMVLIR